MLTKKHARPSYAARALAVCKQPVIRVLLRLMIKHGVGFDELHDGVGLDRHSITNWALHNAHPSFGNVLACLHYLGYTLVVVPKDWVEQPNRPSILSPWSLRQMLKRADRWQTQQTVEQRAHRYRKKRLQQLQAQAETAE